jgi:hypothetical protein
VDPEEKESAPLIPAVPAFAVLIITLPLLLAVPDPLCIDRAPPVPDDDIPALSRIVPPSAAEPVPPLTRIFPDLPAAAFPEESFTLPDEPALVVPEENVRLPLTPAVPAFEVFT